MDMSKAALPAHSGTCTLADRSHPLFNEWRAYEAGCARQMIDGQNFADWLRQRESAAYRDQWAKHPEYPAFMVWMRANQGGARGTLSFPENFKYWLGGGRW